MRSKSIILAIAVCGGTLSCIRSEELVPERVTFRAVYGDAPSSKTTLMEDGSVYWTPNDAINLFYGESGVAMLISTNKDTTAQTTFTGVLEGMTPNGTDEFWAVYPYSAGNSFDGSAVTLTLPAQQTGVAGTFADDLFISMARSTDYTLSFYNLCGGVKFSVDTPGIQYVTFRGNDGEMLAGTVHAAFNADGKPQVTEVAEGVTLLRLDAPNGGFEVGKWYYMVSLPATLSAGYTMTFYDKDDAVVATRERTASVELKRSIWRRVASADVTPVSASKYLTLTSEGTTKVVMKQFAAEGYEFIYPTLYFSVDETNWYAWDYDTLTVVANHPVYLCGDNPDGLSSMEAVNQFVSSGDLFSVSGDIMSLLDKDNELLTIPSDGCFSFLFFFCGQLTSGPSLTATTLKRGCYERIYYECTNLKTAPQLPATTVPKRAYLSMFYNCSSLTTAPELPATELADSCYAWMFYGCENLTSVPDVLPASSVPDGAYMGMFEKCPSLTSPPALPATDLAAHCYSWMFYGCTSLTTAPDLPATRVFKHSYRSMFNGCTSLDTAPELPATELADSCYYFMFNGCSALSAVPTELPATTVPKAAYGDMFRDCTHLTTAPDLPATTLDKACYEAMFYACTSLASVPQVLPATTLSEACYHWMFWGCTNLTNAPALPATTLTEDCYNCMFYGCSSLTAAPELPATTLAPYCYYAMFSGECTSLTEVPDVLPATTLAESCYQFMFWGCSSLTNAPELPATNLAPLCYYSMFERCSSLTTAPQLPATELAEDCYRYMFWSCTSLAEAPELPATALTKGCYYNMFGACESLETAPDLPATELADSCYTYMFSGSLNLKYVKALATNISASGCVDEWLRDVAANGTFIKSAQMNDWPTGISGIPDGWTVEEEGTITASKYLTFASEGTTSISMTNRNGNAPVFYYSYDATNWIRWDYNELTFSLDSPLYLCGNNPNGINHDSSIDYSNFIASGDLFSVSGDIMSLVDRNKEISTVPSVCFSHLFSGCTKLKVAPSLPATALGIACYVWMFENCTSLTAAPELPATQMEEDCYYGMFEGCTSLTAAPELPATVMEHACYMLMFSGCTSLSSVPLLPEATLDELCYAYMFKGCSSLTVAPALPATTLANSCYLSMFQDCTGLVSAPELPATIMAEQCYHQMFSGCTSLVTAPELPATSLANSCYHSMFAECSSLASAPALPATSLSISCYASMFWGCTSLISAPELPAMSIPSSAYSQMFRGCSSLNYVKCLATDMSAEGCLEDWVSDVAFAGVFVKASNANWPSGASGIPEGWTVENYSQNVSLDGRWEALRDNDDPSSTAFVALFEGDNLDLYIIAWGQHYVGTYQYADGAITYTISEAYQAYTDVTATSHSWEAGNLDASTLTLSDGYDWYEMDPDTLANYKEDLQEFSFLLQDGNNSATSALFGLDIVFTKVN